MNVTITCDRCGGTVEGIQDSFQFKEKTINTTGGFVDVIEGEWGQYGRIGETKICDNCLFTDPRYVNLYGKRVPTTVQANV